MLLTLFALAAAALLAPAPIPDVIPEGYHSVAVQRRAEIGPLRDVCCVQYVVKKGDTLTRIAKAQLGSADRHAEIAALNPGVDPTRLSIGERLWLPPRQADLQGPRRYIYYSDFQGLVDARPYALDRQLHGRYGRFTLVLVPNALRAGFEAAQEEGAEPVVAYAKEHRIEWFEGRSVGRMVKDGSSVARISEVIRIVRGEDGKFAIESEVAEYDKNGKRLGAGAGKDGEAGAAWILLLAVAGAALVWWRVRAKGPVAAAEPAAA